MNMHRTMVETYDKLKEFRKQSFANEENEEVLTIQLLKQVNNLANSIKQEILEVDKSVKKIFNDSLSVKYEQHARNFYVGQQCVQPLIQFKKTSTEIFSDIKKYNNNEYKEKPHSNLLYSELEKAHKHQVMNESFIKQMKLTAKGLRKIIENLRNTEKTEASSTECSTSEFSLFEISKAMVATSSPLIENKILKNV